MKINKNIVFLYFLWLFSVLIISYFNLFENLGNFFYDSFLTQNLKSQKVNKEIVIVWVDKKTIEYFWEKSNWTRSRYQWLLSELLTQNPKIILFDYFFSNKSIPENFDWDLYQEITNSSTGTIDKIYEDYQNKIYDKNYISKIDIDFWELIKNAKNVVIPYSYKTDEKSYNIYPIDVIAKNAHLWYANIDNSKDWVIRYRTQNLNDSKSISHIASEIYLWERVWIEKKFYINYFSLPYDRYTSISFHNAYNWIFIDYAWNKVDLKNKIVLVWDYDEIFWDTYKTPVSKDRVSSWVEIIANEIQSIIEGKNINVISGYFELIIITILYILVFLTLYLTKNIYLNIFESILFPTISYFSVSNIITNYFYIDFKNIAFCLFLSYLIVFWHKIFKNYKEKIKIKKEFSRYMDKKLVENILNNENKNSKNQNVTILFLDIEWFTDMSEKLTNKELLKITNKIFSSFNDVILKNNWIIDKYIWDSIMVFWTEQDNNHTFLACKTALELKKSLEKLNLEINQKINIRIWVNSWEVMIWSVWDENFSDYTVIWDNVNLASRLEWINKYYSTRLIISETTFNKVKDQFITRELDNIKVKWKTIWIKIYELLWKSYDEVNHNLVGTHNKAINLYYKKDFNWALEYFNKNKIEFNDKTSEIFIERIKEYQINKSYNDDMIYEFHNK